MRFARGASSTSWDGWLGGDEERTWQHSPVPTGDSAIGHGYYTHHIESREANLYTSGQQYRIKKKLLLKEVTDLHKLLKSADFALVLDLDQIWVDFLVGLFFLEKNLLWGAVFMGVLCGGSQQAMMAVRTT